MPLPGPTTCAEVALRCPATVRGSWDDHTTTDLFLAARTGLPREAPGSEATTRLPADLTGGDVLGVDTREPYLDELRRRGGTGINAPMQDLPLEPDSVELLWAGGSAYLMGFVAALAAWRPLLAPGGVLVLTEVEWTTPDPAPGARAFWDAGHPAMRTTAATVAATQGAGWPVAATYLLSDVDWNGYYGPLAARIEILRAEHPDAEDASDEVAAEIAVRRERGGDYGYTRTSCGTVGDHSTSVPFIACVHRAEQCYRRFTGVQL